MGSSLGSPHLRTQCTFQVIQCQITTSSCPTILHNRMHLLWARQLMSSRQQVCQTILSHTRRSQVTGLHFHCFCPFAIQIILGSFLHYTSTGLQCKGGCGTSIRLISGVLNSARCWQKRCPDICNVHGATLGLAQNSSFQQKSCFKGIWSEVWSLHFFEHFSCCERFDAK